MYCKYAEFACTLQTNLSMNNKQCHDVQKKCNMVLTNLDMKNIQVFAKKMFMISKKDMINKTLQNIGQMQ